MGCLGFEATVRRLSSYTLQSDGVTKTRSRWTVIRPTKDVPFGQEPIFLGVYWMCLHFHDEILSQIEDSVHTRRWCQDRKWKKEIRDSMLATQQSTAKQSKN